MSEFLRQLLLGLTTSGIFFYKALWSILFGVAVTAAVDVFVDKERMAKILGGRDVKTTGIAAAVGAASSACTFGAVTISHVLFKKGASAESTFAFSLASTNIVFELGILIWVLLGPAFLGAELLSGVLLVAIMYLIARATLPVHVFDRAREQMLAREGEQAVPGTGLIGSWRALGNLSGWYRIALRYFKTISRIQNSVIFGFLIAGLIVALVPTSVWTTVFIPPHGFLAVLENAALGVMAGIFSFIASIGIVPFAAALWIGGVGFAGVLGCIVADNLTVPVFNLWKNFFGWRAAAYIFAVFYTAMVSSTVLIEYLFRTAHWLPTERNVAQLASAGIQLNYTLVLTVLFAGLTAGLWVVKRLGDQRWGPRAPQAPPAPTLHEVRGA